ncbi:MAG: esterase, partial [Saprospiraceae bacterium]
MKSLVFFFCFALCLQLDAQCDGSRFRTSTFTGVSISENIIYSQVTPAGLRMDVYEPTGDVSSARPLIIMAHGGSFIA